MREIFIDTSFFAALLNPRDRLRARAESAWRSLGRVRLVTTDAVFTEVLNYFAGWGRMQRSAAIKAIRRARSSPTTLVNPQTREAFDRACQRYAERIDKGSSLTDCDSMLVMEDRGIREVLSSDQHFTQAGFRALLVGE